MPSAVSAVSVQHRHRLERVARLPAVDPAVDHLLADAHGQRRGAGDALAERDGLVEQRVVGHHPLHQADALGLRGVDALAGEHHPLRPVPAHHRGPAQHPEAGHQPDRALGHREARAVGGEHQVAGQRELAAAAERVAVDGGDDRQRALLHRGERAHAVGLERALGRRAVELAEAGDVPAGGERLVPGPGEHHRARRAVRLEAGERLAHLRARTPRSIALSFSGRSRWITATGPSALTVISVYSVTIDLPGGPPGAAAPPRRSRCSWRSRAASRPARSRRPATGAPRPPTARTR